MLLSEKHTISRYSLFLWIEAESELARALLTAYTATRFLSPAQTASIQQALHGLEAFLSETVTCEQARQTVAHICSAFLPNGDLPSPLDDRLSFTLEALKQQVHELSGFSPQQIAALLHLSESRLHHVFGQQFGLPMQRYLLWQRLLTAIESGAHGPGTAFFITRRSCWR